MDVQEMAAKRCQNLVNYRVFYIKKGTAKTVAMSNTKDIIVI